MLRRKWQKAPKWHRVKERGFDSAVQVPVLKEKKPRWDCGAAQRRGPPRQGCSRVPLAAPGARSGGSDHEAQLLSHPSRRTRPLGTAAQPGALTARPVCPPCVCPPRTGNQMKVEGAQSGQPTLIAELVEDLGHFPPVLTRPLKGSFFYNRSKLYTLSEFTQTGFGEKWIAPAEVH